MKQCQNISRRKDQRLWHRTQYICQTNQNNHLRYQPVMEKLSDI